MTNIDAEDRLKDSSNFMEWRAVMIQILQSKFLEPLVNPKMTMMDGLIEGPKHLSMLKDLVTIQIKQGMQRGILTLVQHIKGPLELWTYLESMFMQKSIANQRLTRQNCAT